MATPNCDSPLTAAECAARTGLTARALRLYEEYGLIKPRRSAAGWRRYGPDELVRLNAITLLKAAGLSLAQIGSIFGSSPHEPDLHRMLAIQLENWHARRAEAERGHRIVEAALGRLSASGSLTVNDLCELIRSLETSRQQESSPAQSAEPAPSGNGEMELDGYAGEYRLNEWNVATVKREGGKLFLELPAQMPAELRRTGEHDFEVLDAVGQPVSFDPTPVGVAASLRLRTSGGDIVAERVDHAAAERIRSCLKARIEQQTPLAASAAAVQRLMAGLSTGRLDYDEMTPVLAQIARQQMRRLYTQIAFLGAVRSIDFQGVGGQGWDVYDVRHEWGRSRVQIILQPDGLISGALVVVKLDSETPAP